ncbi:MAG: pyruvate kinase [Amphiamblys sp. WSBS2006]|nr:MAG: pyruvate kinase [Amphiamblys sp. WSBS2006]
MKHEAEISELEWFSNLSVEEKATEKNKTGIICTVSPKVNSPEMLRKLHTRGMNIVRMNFSHGTHSDHLQTIENVKKTFRNDKYPVALALDTKGPEIRLGEIKEGEVTITKGQEVVLTTDGKYRKEGDRSCIFVDYARLPQVVARGSLIYIDDGILSLTVLECREDTVRTEANNTHTISSRRGVNLPYTSVDLPAISEKDRADILFGVENNVDIIFASFIRKASDIATIRNILAENGKYIAVVAKIENHEGVQNIAEIIEEADGIMIARGDLGIEIEPEKVFTAQKKITTLCNRIGKPVICATQMLDSMIRNPRPTRAEISDIGNAVLDGVDCVMLSGETASGSYPLEAVETMRRVCMEAERAAPKEAQVGQLLKHSIERDGVLEAFARSVSMMTLHTKIAAVITLAMTGHSAGLIAKYRPKAPLIAVTRNEKISNTLLLRRGCIPFLYRVPTAKADWDEEVQLRLRWAVRHAVELKIIGEDDLVLLVYGPKTGESENNTFRVTPASSF